MPAHTSSIGAELKSIVGEEHVRRAAPEDAVDGVMPQLVVEPADEAQVAAVLRAANAAGWGVVPRGSGSKLGWGRRPVKADLVLSIQRLNRLREHAWADLTATVDAGCRVADVQSELARHGQRLAIDPLWPERATIGGILSTNDSGAWRLRYGSLRDLMIGITVALPDGTLARSGGKVVKNVAGYDLPKLFTGAFGTLGVITQATFRLYPQAKSTQTLTFKTTSFSAAGNLILAILNSTLVPVGLQMRSGHDEPPCVDLQFEGTEAGVRSQVERLPSLSPGIPPRKEVVGVWRSRERLWENADSKLIGKFSVLPSQLGQFHESVKRLAVTYHFNWAAVAQGFGLGLLAIDPSQRDALPTAHENLRSVLQALGGTWVALQCPSAIKSDIDVWGDVGDALPLMRRIKNQFDPNGILNAGRFVGGL